MMIGFKLMDIERGKTPELQPYVVALFQAGNIVGDELRLSRHDLEPIWERWMPHKLKELPKVVHKPSCGCNSPAKASQVNLTASYNNPVVVPKVEVAPEKEYKEATWGEAVGSFSKAVLNAGETLAKGGWPIVSKEKQKQRYDICKACPMMTAWKSCKLCKCVLPFKTWKKNEVCPMGKWGKEI